MRLFIILISSLAILIGFSGTTSALASLEAVTAIDSPADFLTSQTSSFNGFADLVQDLNYFSNHLQISLPVELDALQQIYGVANQYQPSVRYQPAKNPYIADLEQFGSNSSEFIRFINILNSKKESALGMLDEGLDYLREASDLFTTLR